jgi:hypothetical protein
VLTARALGPWGGLIGRREKAHATALMTLAAVALALGVGAKLYPLVLVPLLVATWLRSPGWRRAWVPCAVFVAASLVICSPMLPSRPAPGAEPRPDPSSGVKAFLRQAEANDLVFRVVQENARPTAGASAEPWYVVLPQRWREAAQQSAARWAGVEPARAPFLVARALTGLAFLVAAGWLAYLAAGKAGTPARWLECAFLTLAWFWLLSPVQNPWYWLWALPLVPFARGRAWLAVGGFALLYYLRFWPPTGGAYFDNVVVWLEYAPWLLWLLAAWAVRPRE